MDCLFCRIIAGEIPSAKVYEDEKIFAFRDINPQAPVHVLLVPKEHIASAAELSGEQTALVAHIFEVITKLAPELGLENGFRVVTNVGEDGTQSVKHLHFHLIGGKQLNGNMA